MNQSSGVETKVTATNAEAEAEAKNSTPGPQVKTKKPYSKPVLKVYGNIDALTTAVSNLSVTGDSGGSGTMTKTH
jgi:hypothetical protein